MQQFTVIVFFLSAAVAAVETQARRHIVALRLELPRGDVRDLRATEGPRAVQIELMDGAEWRSFYLDLTVRVEPEGCAVTVAVRDSQRPNAARLDEFELRADAVTTNATTAPTFGVSLLGVEGC
jgi:hypothetical protein